MAYIVIEGDPGQLEHLLSELYDRNYLDSSLNVKFIEEAAEQFAAPDEAEIQIHGDPCPNCGGCDFYCAECYPPRRVSSIPLCGTAGGFGNENEIYQRQNHNRTLLHLWTKW